MKKITNWLLPFLMTMIIFTSLSCKKELGYKYIIDEEIAAASTSHEPVVRAFRDSIDADLHFVPDFASGWTYPNSAPAWFHGDGHGNATHMGTVNTYFNTYTFKNSDGVVIVYGRPVTMFYASQLLSYSLPSNVHGIIYDNKGNSIWTQIAPEGLATWYTDATHVAMAGTMFLVGGTGKFTDATGETTFNAVFNKLNLQECSMWANGWIKY